MKIPKIYWVQVAVDLLALGLLMGLIYLVFWYVWPVMRGYRLEREPGPFRITVASGFTERVYVGDGPVLFAGNAIYFTDEIGVQHRITGGMVLFDRYDNMAHVQRELFGALRVPVIYDKAYVDSIEHEEGKWTSRPSRKRSAARRRRGTAAAPITR